MESKETFWRTANREGLTYIHDARETRLFRLSIEIAFIFAVPALGASLGGGKLDLMYGTGKVFLFSALSVAFVTSWIVVGIKIYRIHQDRELLSQRVRKEVAGQKRAGLLKPR